MSIPSYSRSYQPNIFELTNSRLHIPTDVLFTRLALIRPLTPSDEALKEKITTPMYVLLPPPPALIVPLNLHRLHIHPTRRTRQIYLRLGPSTLLTCPFCHPTDSNSYLLHHLPTKILLPHLLHLLLLGLATSTLISSPSITTFRTKLSLSALALTILDIYITTTASSSTSINRALTSNSPVPPRGVYRTSLTLRPLSICLHDVLAAGLVYLSATNRLPFLVPSQSSYPSTTTPDSAILKKRQAHLLTQSIVALQTAQTKLRAFSVARSAVVREPALKARDDEYWRAVVGMEGPGDGGGVDGVGVWGEDEVMEAVARVADEGRSTAHDGFGRGVDVERVGKEAGIFVESVTQWLEGEGGSEYLS